VIVKPENVIVRHLQGARLYLSSKSCDPPGLWDSPRSTGVKPFGGYLALDISRRFALSDVLVASRFEGEVHATIGEPALDHCSER